MFHSHVIEMKQIEVRCLKKPSEERGEFLQKGLRCSDGAGHAECVATSLTCVAGHARRARTHLTLGPNWVVTGVYKP